MLVKDKSPNKSQMKAIESQMNSICFRFPHNHQKFGSQTFCKQGQSKNYSSSKLISFNLLNKGCVTISSPARASYCRSVPVYDIYGWTDV